MRNTFPTSSTAVLCLVVPAVQAFIIPCIYQSYKCGFNLVIDYGTHNDSSLCTIPFK
jgi:hypothetical protein